MIAPPPLKVTFSPVSCWTLPSIRPFSTGARRTSARIGLVMLTVAMYSLAPPSLSVTLPRTVLMPVVVNPQVDAAFVLAGPYPVPQSNA